MGEMQVPDEVLYGASTQRAVLNFPVSRLRFQREFIAALGVIKKAAALANLELKLLDEKKTGAIVKAADEVISGKLDSHFVVDIFQTGSGTSTNMNANEVIANRAIQLLGGKIGDRNLMHPNDHVNVSQSSNDVIPTAIHMSAEMALEKKLMPALSKLAAALETKAKEFSQLLKSGRTHLQDATPITLGQEFSGYAAQVRHGMGRIERARITLRELALGGTAVGTGLNAPSDFAARAITHINKITSLKFIEAPNHFEAQAAQDGAVELSGQLKTVSCSLMKIANDIRWLSSGPRCGLGELQLPETQPGSSIMPAKVNPVICESVMMICAQVMGNDTCITVAGQHGNFELNVMLPVIAYNLLESIELLSSGCLNFVERCISGIKANRDKCLDNAEKSLAVCTSLAPLIGYDKAAELAKKALKENKTMRQTALEMKVLPEAKLLEALDLMRMTRPGIKEL